MINYWMIYVGRFWVVKLVKLFFNSLYQEFVITIEENILLSYTPVKGRIVKLWCNASEFSRLYNVCSERWKRWQFWEILDFQYITNHKTLFLHHNFTIRPSTGVYESGILSSIYYHELYKVKEYFEFLVDWL